MEKLKAYLIYSSTLIGIFLFVFLVFNAFEKVADEAVSAEVSEKELIVVIDAGHGGEDSGAVANSVLEKDINLEIALKLRDMLKASGIEVKMIRESDISIYDTASGTIRERKVSDLKNRVEIVNDNKKNILVSIHQNKFEQSKYSGAQMFYSTNNDRSQILAENIRKSITGLIQPENKRELKKGGSDIYLLNKANVPAVIVECGFISNEEEAKNLSNEEYQSKMAFAIYCGILEYKNKN
ncbi:N-acetylmuramoyl-L-alanine amidase [Candidatus Pseudoruminococcus sp.]|uniref:N-acetylmuramoyl-L-alanine amidase n=1 Tax=Candidatus Pseudoruminococcus sp. TaxID=3101048 RepID=UPI00399A9EE0